MVEKITLSEQFDKNINTKLNILKYEHIIITSTKKQDLEQVSFILKNCLINNNKDNY